MTLTLFSPAKINLFLHITAKRSDGYHDLQSVFRALDFGDTLKFRFADSTAPLVTLQGADGLTADMTDNLIYRAAAALAKAHPKKAKPVHISLDKLIPTGAGLGGGSSNCATTLIALNHLWDLGLSTEALIDIAATLGADVPFIIFSHAHQCDAEARGIGEQLSRLPLAFARYLLLLPQAHLATALFFKHPDLRKDYPILTDLSGRTDEFMDMLSADFSNVFEPIAFSAAAPVQTAYDYLLSLQTHTGTQARMSGTGSTVFLPIPAHIEDSCIRAWQAAAPCPSVLANSLYHA